MAAQYSAGSLPGIFKLIQEAQGEDASGNERGAYYHYLLGVQQMAGVLLQCSPDTGHQSVVPPDKAKKLFVMAKQSFEQAETLFATAFGENRGFNEPPQTRPRSMAQVHVTPQQQLPQRRTMSASVPMRGASPTSPSHVARSPSVPHRQKLQNPHMFNQRQPEINPLYRLSPMEEARRRNTHLMSQYQANLKRKSSAMLIDRRQNLSLNYLRRREENLSVARITERAIANKLRSREVRIHEEQQRVKYHKSVDLMSLDELVEEITLFEQGKNKLIALKHQLTASPSSSDCVCNLINEVLSMSDHPIAKLFGERQFQVVQVLMSLANTIQKSGGLPRLEIQDEQVFLSPERRPHSSSTSHPRPQTTHHQSSTVSLPSHQHPSPTGSKTLPARSRPPTDNTTPPNSPTDDFLEQKLAALRSKFNDNDEGNEDLSRTSADEKERVANHNTLEVEEGHLEEKEEKEETTACDKDSDSCEVNAEVEEREKEVEEEVVFRGLPQLKCSLHLGYAEVMAPLSEKSSHHLQEAEKMIHEALNKLVHICSVVYPEVSKSDNKEVAGVFLEAHFFPALMEHLRLVYRCANYATECAVAKNMYKYVNATPKDLSVRKKFYLHDQDTPPYAAALKKLQSIQALSYPAPKLECLVSLSKSIIQCIEEYYESQGTEKSAVDTAVGVDDILPILSYIIIRSGMPMLVSESAFMQEFIPESYAMGEEGFCLTSFHTALQFVAQMSS